MNILMAGKSEIKANGIKLAFSNLFPNKQINIIESTAPSLINEQPIGYSEGEHGLRNRLRGALNYAKEHEIQYDYLVVIESYLSEANGLFNVDTALILIKDNEDKTYTFKSDSLVLGNGEDVVYDPKITTLAEALVPFINSEDYNHKDPHQYFTESKKSRSDFIAKAITDYYYSSLVL